MLSKGRRVVNWFHGELGVDGLFLIVRVRNHSPPGQCRAGIGNRVGRRQPRGGSSQTRFPKSRPVAE